MSARPVVSVIMVADYAPGEDRGWVILRNSLRAMAQQDFAEPVEFVLAEQSVFGARIPDDLEEQLPGLRVLLAEAPSAHALKNAAAREVSADIVAFLDADCAPDPSWLRSAVAALRAHPEVSVVSGRTRYAGSGRRERILSLCDRAFLDSGRTRITVTISNNNCAFRRAAFLDHPLRQESSFYGGRAQAQALQRAGHQLLFDPHMLAYHHWDGWGMEREYRRQVGYGVVALRRVDPESRFASLMRAGAVMIPAIVGYRALRRLIEVCRAAPQHRVAWYELPVALAVAFGLHLMEAPGMWRAFRNQPFRSKLYR